MVEGMSVVVNDMLSLMSVMSTAGLHGRLAQKNDKSDAHCWGRDGSVQFAQQFAIAVTAPPRVGCVVWSLSPWACII